MRGKIDLGDHKLANVYRPPARSSRRTRMEKQPDATYRQLWRLVDGAVRDAFANHPDYLTDKGKRDAARSVTKRVVGTLHGYAAQVAWGRSRKLQAPAAGTAAEKIDDPVRGRGLTTWFTRALSWVGVITARTRGRAVSTSGPKFKEGE